MTSINERILSIRKSFSLSRAAFGQSLGVSGDVIKNLDYNLTEPKPAFIELICRTYNVKSW